MEKLCASCKVNKNTSEFYKDKYQKGGLKYKCKECTKKYVADFYKNVEVIERSDKRCTHCREIKDINDFCNDFYSRDKKESCCKDCMKEKFKSYIENIQCECGKTIKYKYNFPKHLLSNYHRIHAN